MKLHAATAILSGILCVGCPADHTKVCVKATDTSAKNLTVAVSAGKSCSETLYVGGFAFWRGEYAKNMWDAVAVTPKGDLKSPALSSITYGQLPQGFATDDEALPLKPGDEILVDVSGSTKTKPDGGNSLKITLTD
jgi:hypothetical protein